MCGIAGILRLDQGAPPDLDALSRMAAAMRHRGPDGWGVYRDATCGLAHVRLSIIDLAAGAQPLCNEEGTLWISFNGEVFNYLELREELLALGHVFRTRSDTEVIVHAFEAWGAGCFERFNGQWAVALWDAVRRRLVIARDRLGVRPIHLACHAGQLLFASEVKAIYAAAPGLPRAFDVAGLAETFTFWCPVPPRTPLAGITELRPGVMRSYEPDGRVVEQAYWHPSYPCDGERRDAFGGSLPEAVEAVQHTLSQATRLRLLRADVPVGAYLSGGLDSSLVAALARQASSGQLRTFSLRFEDAEYDETTWQRIMVQRLETEHEEVLVSRGKIAAAFWDAVYHAERPMLRTAPAPLLLLSRLVSQAGIKVVLTGEGADEMFAGYDLFREAKVRRFWARQPGSRLRPRLLERLYPYLARSPVSQRAMAEQFFGRELGRAGEPGFSHGPRWSSAAALQRLFTPELRRAAAGHQVQAGLMATLPAEYGRWTSLAQDQYLEVRTLLAGYLLCTQGDRMLMANSVEGRFPFLDREVVALAASLPARFKLRGLDEKHVLKRAAQGLVPDEIRHRRKQPYRAPDALSFSAADAPPWVEELLSAEALRAAGVFDPGPVGALWAKCCARRDEQALSNADNMGVVGVLSTQVLWERLLRRPVELAPLPPGLLVDRLSPVHQHVRL